MQVDRSADVRRDDHNTVGNRKTRPVGGEENSVFFAKASNGEIGATRHDAVTVEAGDPQIRRQGLRSGIDDDAVGRWRRDSGGDHGNGTILQALAAQSDLVCVAIDVGTWAHLGNAAAQGKTGGWG